MQQRSILLQVLKTSAAGSALVLSVLLFFCESVNPYEDPETSGIEVTPVGIDTGDSVSIGCTRPLIVALLVREHLKAYRILLPENRLWDSSDSLVGSDEFSTHPHTFSVSYADTGRHIIRAEGIRSRGDTVAVEVPVYAYSPLHQETIVSPVKEQIRLITEPVCDEDVEYVWQFGADTFSSSTRFPIVKPTREFSGDGLLWVRTADTRSPAYTFKVSITMPSSFTLLALGPDGSHDPATVEVPPEGTRIGARIIGDLSQLESVAVEGEVFREFSLQEDSLDFWADVAPLDVDARRATISYTTITGGQGTGTIVLLRIEDSSKSNPSLRIRYPSEDATVRSPELKVTGDVSGTEEWDSVAVHLLINGRRADSISKVTGADWESGVVEIDSGSNTIEALLYWANDSLVSSDIVSFTRVIDTSLSVKIETIEGMSVPDDSVLIFNRTHLEIGVVAGPDSSVETVLVNNETASEGAWLYTVEIDIEPNRKETPIVAEAKMAGRSVFDTVTVVYNRAPEWDTVIIPKKIIVGDTVIITAFAEDEDNDDLTISGTILRNDVAVETLNFTNRETQWHVSDSGLYEIVLKAYDDYEITERVTYRLVQPPDEKRTVSFTDDISEVDESEGTGRVVVSLSAAADNPVTVGYKRGVEATQTEAEITFDRGETTAEVVYNFNDDFRLDGDETVLFTLESSDENRIEVGQPGTHKLTIRDDDYSLSVESSEGGGVSVNPPPRGVEKTYGVGTSVTLTAEPEEGYRFSTWSGDPVDEQSGNTAQVTMNTSKTIRASFVETTQPIEKPTITSHPGDTTVEIGDSATLAVAADGESLEFQWYRGTQRIGTSQPTYTASDLELEDNGTRYYCVVSNSGGSVVSDTAVLTVIPPPVIAPGITRQPEDQTVSEGEQAVFTVDATGDEPLTFAWLHNGTILPNESGRKLTTAVLEADNDGDTYRCVVRNGGGTDTSRAARVSVLQVPDTIWKEDLENAPKGTSLCTWGTWSAVGSSADCDKLVIRERDGGNVIAAQTDVANTVYTPVPKSSSGARLRWRWRYVDWRARVAIGPVDSTGIASGSFDDYRVRVQSAGSKWEVIGERTADRGGWPKLASGTWYYMQFDLDFETNTYSLSYATSPDRIGTQLVNNAPMNGSGSCEYIMMKTAGNASGTVLIDDIVWERVGN